MTSSNDPLQKLLRDSLRMQLIAKRNNSLRAKAERLEQEYKAKLHDEANWIPSGIISIIHTAEDGTQTTIGMFQELRNKHIKDGRRLIRIESDKAMSIPVNEVPSEFVSGQLWINGKQVLNPEPNYHPDPADQSLIRDYLKRTAPPTLAQQLRDLNAEKLLQQLFDSNFTWRKV